MRVTKAALVPLFALCALGVAACQASSAALPMVRTEASDDLDCPGDNIRIEETIGGRFVAVGCGHKARYWAACDGLRCVVRGEDETMIPWRERPEPSQPRP